MLPHMLKYLSLLGMVTALFILGIMGHAWYEARTATIIEPDANNRTVPNPDQLKFQGSGRSLGVPEPAEKTGDKAGGPGESADTAPASKEKPETKPAPDSAGTKPAEVKPATPPKPEAEKPDAGKQPEKTPPAPPK